MHFVAQKKKIKGANTGSNLLDLDHTFKHHSTQYMNVKAKILQGAQSPHIFTKITVKGEVN